MSYFTSYIYIIFALKITFILFAIATLYLKLKKRENTESYKFFSYWKERVEFVFVILMSFLLVYLFNPRQNRNNMINGETKLLLYLFGFVLLITANWSTFIGESIWVERAQDIAGK
jgi:uncharacterized membrane protein YiaA